MTELDKFKEWLQEPAFPLPLAVIPETHDSPPYIEWATAREARGITRLEYYMLQSSGKSILHVLSVAAGLFNICTGTYIPDNDIGEVLK